MRVEESHCAEPHLEVLAGVADDQHAGLAELLGDLVGEGAGGEAAGHGLGTSGAAVLQHGTLGVGAGGDGNHIRLGLNLKAARHGQEQEKWELTVSGKEGGQVQQTEQEILHQQERFSGLHTQTHRHNHTGSQHELLPRLGNVQNVEAWQASTRGRGREQRWAMNTRKKKHGASCNHPTAVGAGKTPTHMAR